ncbi:MAG: hypothetical protein ACK4VN_02910 [Bacteroidales bacterium]
MIFLLVQDVVSRQRLRQLHRIWIAPRWDLMVKKPIFITGLHPVLVIAPRWGYLKE